MQMGCYAVDSKDMLEYFRRIFCILWTTKHQIYGVEHQF